jgi:hypothetical protein
VEAICAAVAKDVWGREGPNAERRGIGEECFHKRRCYVAQETEAVVNAKRLVRGKIVVHRREKTSHQIKVTF